MKLPPRIKKSKIRPIEVRGDIAVIPLTRGYEAVIDVDDLPLVEGRNWGATAERDRIYAKTTVTVSVGRQRIISLHRLIANVDDPLIEVDHRDGDGLNNRRANLRVCDRSRNSWNRGLESTSTTGFKGVSYVKSDNRYEAKIRFHVRRLYLGRFATAEQAAAAYDIAAELAFGDFAKLNFPPCISNAHSIYPKSPFQQRPIKIADPWKVFRGTPLGTAILTILCHKQYLATGTVPDGCKIVEMEIS